MNAGELLTLFREDTFDLAEPFLWSDPLVLSYIDDAQIQFCRRTDGIADATTDAVTKLAIVPNTEWYDFHPSILKVRSALRADTGRPVEVINHEDMASRNWYFDGRTGPVRALVLGIEEAKARVWPKPNETVEVRLTTFRLPLATINDVDQNFEIPAEHHQHLLHWVKHRAYGKQDAETFDRTKSKESADAFLAYCFDAKLQQERRRHKTRVVVYGGL